MTLNFYKFQSLHVFILHVNIGTPLLWTRIKLVYNCFLELDGLVRVSPKPFYKTGENSICAFFELHIS